MKRFSMRDIIKRKKEGDEWFCPKAPEEFHTWHTQRPWKSQDFRKYKAKLISVRLHASMQASYDRDDWDAKDPLIINNCYYTGSHTISQNITAVLCIRPEIVEDITEHVVEFNNQYNFNPKLWSVKEMDVYLHEKGNSLEYGIFNPNGVQSSLYLWRIVNSEYARNFDELQRFDLDNHIGSFYEEYAACELISSLEPKCKLRAKDFEA